MKAEENYIHINRTAWNAKTDIHIQSEFYNMEAFLNGKSSLNSIEMPLLGDVEGKRILHLQCHFGQDTLSLSRMGAKVTGVDLSDKAIQRARELNDQLGLDATFVCCDLYDLPQHITESFDMVFTSYGTIGWLPNLDKWASIVSYFLKPNGTLVFAEFHPVVWMFDDNFNQIAYRYFNSGAIVETESGTYADTQASISQQYVMWNHGLGEVLTSLMGSGLVVESFTEYDYSPYNCFLHTVEFEPNKYRIKHLDNKIPMVYALKARKI